MRDKLGGTTVYKPANVLIEHLGSDTPKLTDQKDGVTHTVICDYVVGFDGYHGVSRRIMTENVLKEHERVYPFGWLGILADTRPVAEELIYANYWRGFPLCSMRSMTRSRYYTNAPSMRTWRNGSTTGFGKSSESVYRNRLPRASKWDPPSRKASRRSGASLPGPCGTNAFSWAATLPTLCRPLGPRA